MDEDDTESDRKEMRDQKGNTNHHVGLHHRSSSKVPRTFRVDCVSTCIMIVGKPLPRDISNPCIVDDSESRIFA